MPDTELLTSHLTSTTKIRIPVDRDSEREGEREQSGRGGRNRGSWPRLALREDHWEMCRMWGLADVQSLDPFEMDLWPVFTEPYIPGIWDSRLWVLQGKLSCSSFKSQFEAILVLLMRVLLCAKDPGVGA